MSNGPSLQTQHHIKIWMIQLRHIGTSTIMTNQDLPGGDTQINLPGIWPRSSAG